MKKISKRVATGALAILAAVGSSSVFADEVSVFNNDEKELSSSDTGKATVTATGYQTDDTKYEVKVSWGDMQFIYDRGMYDATTNVLEKKAKATVYNEDKTPKAYDADVSGTENSKWNCCEAGVNGGVPLKSSDVESTSSEAGSVAGAGVNKWCGFDGKNNQVIVENLGTGNVGLNVACQEAESVGSGTDMQIAVKSTDAVSTTDNWKFTGSTETKNMYVGDDATAMTIGKSSATSATTTIAKVFDVSGNVSGDQAKANSVEFYLNITGAPASTFKTDAENTTMADIGTMTLTFTPGGLSAG